MPDLNASGPPTLDLRTASDALDSLCKALIAHIEGDGRAALQRKHKGLATLLSNFARMSDATWRALRPLLTPKDGVETDLFVAAGPLVRTLLEATMSLVFIGEDLVPRSVWYFRSGWRDAMSLQARLDRRYGSDPKWKAYLDGHRQWVESHESDFGIGPAEKKRPTLATPNGWWPNPGKMVALTVDSARKTFLSHVNEWIYGELSGNAHLAYMGLARTASLLHATATERAKVVARSKVIMRSVALHAALLSEVALLVDERWAKERAAAIWGLLSAVDAAADLRDQRYAAALGIDAASP